MEVHQPHDDRGLLGAAFGDQPAGRLGQHLPGEEEECERGHRDDLQDLPGGDQPANQREEDLAQGPGDADDADDEAPLADVGDLAEDVHRGLKQGQHPEGRGHLNRNITWLGPGQCSPLSLVEVQSDSALIGRELQSVATPVILCHKEPAR